MADAGKRAPIYSSASDARGLFTVLTAAGLDRAGLFRLVNNGRELLSASDEEDLFRRRYLLSPATTAAAFEGDALRRDQVGNEARADQHEEQEVFVLVGRSAAERLDDF